MITEQRISVHSSVPVTHVDALAALEPEVLRVHAPRLPADMADNLSTPIHLHQSHMQTVRKAVDALAALEPKKHGSQLHAC
jgi:hypothetical protein